MGMYNSKLKLDNKYKCWFNAYTTWINQWIERFGQPMWENVAKSFRSDILWVLCPNHAVCTHSLLSFLWSAMSTVNRAHLMPHWRFLTLMVISMTCNLYISPASMFFFCYLGFFSTVLFLISVPLIIILYLFGLHELQGVQDAISMETKENRRSSRSDRSGGTVQHTRNPEVIESRGLAMKWLIRETCVKPDQWVLLVCTLWMD